MGTLMGRRCGGSTDMQDGKTEHMTAWFNSRMHKIQDWKYELIVCSKHRATENAGMENAIRSKNARVKNAGV